MPISLKKVSQHALISNDGKLDLLVGDFLRSHPFLKDVAKHETNNSRTLAGAAGLIELFALRSKLEPPSWASDIGGIDRPFFLQSDAVNSGWLRELCLQESPEPLRKRNLFASANFLASV
jgi:hypothetical protein